MILEILNHDFHYEMENLCRMFFPFEKIIKTYEPNKLNDDIVVTTKLIAQNNTIKHVARIKAFDNEYICESYVDANVKDLNAECEFSMTKALFEVLKNSTNYTPSWGILTGVRPSKLMTKLISTYGEKSAKKYFAEKLIVSEAKTDLAFNVAKSEMKIIDSSTPRSFSLYISIPFCPTRCSYCSFVSHSITSPQAKNLIPEYVEKLCQEIEIVGKYAKNLELKLESVYWGGGTPTSLDAEDINIICNSISKSFDVNSAREYTIEAGRPDTVTKKKLEVIKRNAVTRISINPQTFDDTVLKNIGRLHSSQKTIDAFMLARSLGFDNINMDLIAGLPGDSVENFSKSLNKTIECNPENITVHTLALKRSSTLVSNGETFKGINLTSKMLEKVENTLPGKGFAPYYMYRQSRSLGNLENVGWSKKGYKCLYNVFMMEECHTVLAAGAGAVTKLKQPLGDYIERIFNFKYPYEYINRFEELMERKQRIYDFYNS
ncbi:MAG TPA: coproporphyrinogen dehydrogenase HemZ [Clostridia bacterium]|nr:coproporphyrinogen dehydrogenase HemZ [Clostridia bacterium]